MNTIEIFHSLCALAEYNNILHYMSEVLLSTSIDLHVWHILEAKNIIANALSW